jgi:hypothetical protein
LQQEAAVKEEARRNHAAEAEGEKKDDRISADEAKKSGKTKVSNGNAVVASLLEKKADKKLLGAAALKAKEVGPASINAGKEVKIM